MKFGSAEPAEGETNEDANNNVPEANRHRKRVITYEEI